MISEKTITNNIKKFAKTRDEYYKQSYELENKLNEFTENQAYKIVCFDEYCELKFPEITGDIIVKTIKLSPCIKGNTMRIHIPKGDEQK